MAFFGVEIGRRPDMEMYCEWGDNDRYLFSRGKINTSELGTFGIKVGKFKDTKFYKGLKKFGRGVALRLPKVTEILVKVKEPIKQIVKAVAPKQSETINKFIDKMDYLEKPAQMISDMVKRKIEKEMRETEEKALQSNLPESDKKEISTNTTEALAGINGMLLPPEKIMDYIVKNAPFFPLIKRNKTSENKMAGLSKNNEVSIPTKRLKAIGQTLKTKKLNGEACGRLFLSGSRNGVLKTPMKGTNTIRSSTTEAPNFDNFFDQ